MKLPFLKNRESPNQSKIIEFKGYNANSVVEEGEMSETWNLSTDEYPCLSPRKPRKMVKDGLTSPTALHGKTKLAYVDGTNFLYDGVVKGVVTTGKKQITSIGDRIIIFPDKTYYDISDDVYGTLEKTYTSGANQITFTTNTITTTGADFAFRVGDAVKITGCTVKTANNTTAIITAVAAKTLTFNANTFQASTETAAITLKREVPDMDYICEYNNRIWGCKGSDIYASKLGDPFNFYVYAGLSSDSYAVPVGTDGDFTGCIGYTTHIVFFKENYIHKLYGSKPSNFQLNQSQCHGLQAGCEKSLATIDDVLIYKSRVGIMAYLGNIPDLISKQFGNRRFSEAVAGTDGVKYYASLKNGTNWEMFVYDVGKSRWMMEDHTHAIDFAFLDGKLHYLNADDKKIYQASDEAGTEVVEWKAVFGEMNETVEGKKLYSRFNLHMELYPESRVRISINTDRTGWREIKALSFDTRKTVSIPIIPTRCDIFAMKVEGVGRVKIYSLSKIVQVGPAISLGSEV